ncbi:MAG: hypothetical protein WAN03_09910 [Candidatus Sulfotelmatobacter sp.]
MKKLFAVGALLALGVWLGGCASRTLTPTNLTAITSGNWEATLSGGLGEACKLDFLANFQANSGGGALDITAFSFINVDSNSCFSRVQSESGSTILTTNVTDQVTGSMIMTIISSSPSGNTLTLSTTAGDGLPGGEVTGIRSNGAVTNGAVTGNWTLTGTNGCTGQGTFLMCQGAATCTPVIE